jgi:aminotransferase
LISNALFDLGFEVHAASGGYFIWSVIPAQFSDGFRFAVDLYEQTGVAVVPGIHFSPMTSRFIRINIAREKAEIVEALGKLREFIEATGKSGI